MRRSPNHNVAPVAPDRPEPGHYRVRLIRGGPWLGCRIWADGEDWRCEVGGRTVDVWNQWPYCAGQPIPESEYRYLLARQAHAEEYDPSAPEANPRKPVDWSRLRPPF